MLRTRTSIEWRKAALPAMAVLVLGLAAGCARFPQNASPVTGKRLIITLTVAGEIDPNYHYYVAFDTSGTSAPGPLPVVAKPWGNGWGTGNITNYVVYDGLQPQGYGVYRIVPGTDLLTKEYVGPPVSWVSPPAGANRLQFTIDLAQLATTAVPVDKIDLVNINFITTDVVPLDPNASVDKHYDALGPVGNDFITISVKTNQTYSNSQTAVEGPDDVALPNLDIIDWSVEVQGN
jgi:hypothetical protein